MSVSELQSILTQGKALRECCDDEIQASIERLEAVRKQFQAEQNRRQIKALEMVIQDWTSLLSCIDTAPLSLKQPKKSVGSHAYYLQQLQKRVRICLDQISSATVKQVALTTYTAFYEFTNMFPPTLKEVVFEDVTITSGSEGAPITLPPSIQSCVWINVQARLQLDVFRHMTELKQLTIDSQYLLGKLQHLGEKPHLEILRINAQMRQSQSAEVRGSLGHMNSLPTLPRIKTLALVNCNIQGKLGALNRYHQTIVSVDLSFNPIGGNVASLQKFSLLSDINFTNCRIMDVWDNFLSWMMRQPQLRKVRVEGITEFGAHALQYVAVNVPGSERRFIPASPQALKALLYARK